MIALSESDESSPSVEKPTRYVPPKDALLKLLGVEHDRNAVRKNISGLQYTTMTPVPEMQWEPVSLEEAYETAMRGLEANYSKIRTPSGECRELIIDQLDRQMKEGSHLNPLRMGSSDLQRRRRQDYFRQTRIIECRRGADL